MTLRTASLLCLFLATGCNSGKIDGDDDSAGNVGTDTTTDGGDVGGNGGGSDGAADGDDDPADFVGAWNRDEPLDIDGEATDVEWTANADGSCQVVLSQARMVFEFACSYAVSTGNFTIDDVECSEGEGSYTYVLSGDQLTFPLVEAPCDTRREALASNWTRS